VQLISGVLVTFLYVCHPDMAFRRVAYLMVEANWGWILRLVHSNGASFFFLLVYLHMARGFLVQG